MPGRSAATRRKAAERRKNREMPVADDGQEYARVLAMLGNGRVRAKFGDGSERQCRIRGSMRRREWVHVGDVVLVALRDLAGDKADIVYKYQQAEVQRLKRLGEPVSIAADDEEAVMGDYVEFEGDDLDDTAESPRRKAPGMPESGSDDDSDLDWERI